MQTRHPQSPSRHPLLAAPPGAAPPEWVGTRVEVGQEVWPPVGKETAEALEATAANGIPAVVEEPVEWAEIRQEVWAALRIF